MSVIVLLQALRILLADVVSGCIGSILKPAEISFDQRVFHFCLFADGGYVFFSNIRYCPCILETLLNFLRLVHTYDNTPGIVKYRLNTGRGQNFLTLLVMDASAPQMQFHNHCVGKHCNEQVTVV